MNWKGKRVTVTGGAGFIGSHLVDRLIGLGAHVVVHDNHSRGRNNNTSAAVVTDDLAHRVPEFINKEIVFHLAAKVTGIHYNTRHHFDMMMTNLAINWNVAEAVARCLPDLFVYVSTACVYPHDAPVPTPEAFGLTCNPEPTNWGYGVAKWVGEQQARFLYREYGVPTLVVRFFNAFGPRDYYDKATSHVAPALIRRAHELRQGEPLVVWGSGMQSRALVDARDIAKALTMLAEMPKAHDAHPVNIGHRREITMNALAGLVLSLSHIQADIQNDRQKPDGYPRRSADTRRLESLIGWVPDTPIDKTLKDMIVEFQQGRANL